MLETKTMEFEEQVFRRILEHKGTKKTPDFLEEEHAGFSDGFCRTRFPTDF